MADHLTPPTALKKWYDDNGNVYVDVDKLADDQYDIVGSEVLNSGPADSSYTATEASDLQTYKQDLAAAQQDIASL